MLYYDWVGVSDLLASEPSLMVTRHGKVYAIYYAHLKLRRNIRVTCMYIKLAIAIGKFVCGEQNVYIVYNCRYSMQTLIRIAFTRFKLLCVLNSGDTSLLRIVEALIQTLYWLSSVDWDVCAATKFIASLYLLLTHTHTHTHAHTPVLS